MPRVLVSSALIEDMPQGVASAAAYTSLDVAVLDISQGLPDATRLHWKDWGDGPPVVLLAGWKGDASGVIRIEGTLTVNGVEHQLVIANAGVAGGFDTAEAADLAVGARDEELHAGTLACLAAQRAASRVSSARARAATGRSVTRQRRPSTPTGWAGRSASSWPISTPLVWRVVRRPLARRSSQSVAKDREIWR